VRQIIYPRADQAGATPDAGSKPEVLNAKRTENPDEDSAEGLGLNEQAEAAGLFRKAMDTAMRMLALREHSASELTHKLHAKGHEADTVEKVLAELQVLDLQSDLRFTESFLRTRLSRGQGPMRIRYDLAQKGISETLLEEALTQPAEFWLEVAEQARSRRFGDDLPSGDADAWNAQARFLSRRGFPSDLIYRILGSRY